MKALIAVIAGALAMAAAAHAATPADDARKVADLDTAYQAAVKVNDAEGMARILHPDFVLVVGSGNVFSRENLLKGAREKSTIYEHRKKTPAPRPCGCSATPPWSPRACG